MTAFLIAICTSCYICQIFFNKLYSINYPGKSSDSAAVFSVIYGLVVGIVVFTICNGFSFVASPETIVFGVVEGVTLFFYNLGMTGASATGPFAFHSLVATSGSIVFAVIASIFLWGDGITWLQLAGMGIMLFAFFLINRNGLDFSGAKRFYFLWVAIGACANGLYGVIMDGHQRVMLQTEKNEMIIVTFLSSALLSLLYLFIKNKGRIKGSFNMGGKAALFSLGSSVGAAFAVFLVMILLGRVQVSILYSIQNGLIIAGNVFLSAIVFKEKITRNAFISIVLIIVSIVMLSL